MTMIFSLSDPVIICGIIGAVVVVLVLIAALYLKKTRKPGSSSDTDTRTGQKVSRFAYQPETRPVPAVVAKTIPRPVKKSPARPIPQEISLLNGRSDITGSLQAMVEKYSLDQFTIATSDGLIFASSGGQSAQEDAAHYGEWYTNDPLSETPGVVLSGVSHKGSDLILIIRTPLPVTEEIRHCIESDTKDILNWWI
jgi:hypothetical protein